MKIEKQNEAIAKILGWKEQNVVCGWDNTTFVKLCHPNRGLLDPVPEFASDLNEMHVAEMTIKSWGTSNRITSAYYRYLNILACNGNLLNFEPATATAEQRSKAFLMAFDAWEDLSLDECLNRPVRCADGDIRKLLEISDTHLTYAVPLTSTEWKTLSPTRRSAVEEDFTKGDVIQWST